MKDQLGGASSRECSSPSASPSELGAGSFPRLLFGFWKLGHTGEGRRGVQAAPGLLQGHFIHKTFSDASFLPTWGPACTLDFRFSTQVPASLAKATSQDGHFILARAHANPVPGALLCAYLHTERWSVSGSADAPALCSVLLCGSF